MGYTSPPIRDRKITREDEINTLVKRFRDDPQLLNEVLVFIRKDKIDKIKNR